MSKYKFYIILFSIYLNLIVTFSYIVKLGRVSYRKNINEFQFLIFVMIFLILNGLLSFSIYKYKSMLNKEFGIIFYISSFIHWIITSFIIIVFTLSIIVQVISMEIKL